jgi:outer membrane protein TolC
MSRSLAFGGFKPAAVSIVVAGLLAAAIGPVSASAETSQSQTTPINLSEALGDFNQSPTVERAKSAAEEVSWRRVESYSGFLPTVQASASRLLDREWLLTDVQLAGSPAPVAIPQILPTTVYSLGANWVLFDGLANIQRFQAARSFERSGKHEFDWTKFQGSRNVVLLFYRALAAQTLRDVAAANLKTLEDHLNDVQLFKKAGAGTKFDVLRVDVQTSEARSELLNANDNMSISLLRLAELIGQDLTTRTLQGQLPVLSPDLVQNLTYDEAKRSDIHALQSRVEALEDTASAANKFWIPRVSVGGQYQHYNNRNDEFSGDGFRDAYSVALNLNWNLWDGGVSYARDRQAVEQKVQAEKTLQLSKLKSKNDFEFWRRRYLYYASVYQARTGDVAKSSESVRLAREGRRVGTRTNTDLLDAEAELFRARAGLVNSQIGAVEALINLELATGQSLYQFQ